MMIIAPIGTCNHCMSFVIINALRHILSLNCTFNKGGGNLLVLVVVINSIFVGGPHLRS